MRLSKTMIPNVAFCMSCAVCEMSSQENGNKYESIKYQVSYKYIDVYEQNAIESVFFCVERK